MAAVAQQGKPGQLPARTLGIGLTVLSAALGVAGLLLGSFHVVEWSAVALVLLAFLGRRLQPASLSAAALAGLGGLFVAGHGLLAIHGPVGYASWSYLAGGIAVAGLSIGQVTRAIPRWRRLDPVVLVAIQLGLGLVARWFYYFISGAGLDPNRYGVDTWATPFVEELPLLALGLAGVGLGVFRGPRQSTIRLGLAPPTWWGAAAAVGIVILLSFLDRGADWLTYLLTPTSYDAINAIEDKASGGLAIGLVGSVMAGICEEALFRGALQPRVGVVIAALLFAAGHLYYGATPILVFVFASGLVYGWLRQRINLTAAILAHAGYDVTATIPSGIGRVGLLLLGVVLVAAAMRSDRSGWSRYMVPLAAAGALIVVGACVASMTGNEIVWKAFVIASFLSMASAVLLEGIRSQSLALTVGGLLAWLAAIAIDLSPPWPGLTRWFAFPVWFALVVVGVGAWYRLANSGRGLAVRNLE